jgi:1,4-alpha-glucan branching enzyme
MNEAALSLCAIDADSVGASWHEGTCFLENLINLAAGRDDVVLMTPREYLSKQDTSAFQTISPEYSSSGWGGYAEAWLDSSNDWIYRHLVQGIVRMGELAQRFPNAGGLVERVLNQACREILFAQNAQWPRMIFNDEDAAYAANRIETHLRNFTTFYEALGSNHVDTRLLTTLEQNNGIFAGLCYRVFRPKKS